MAVPKTTETRCREGSGQARHDIQRLHKQPHPYIFFLYLKSFCELCYKITGKSNFEPEKKKRYRDGVTCVVFVYHVLPAHCLPYT